MGAERSVANRSNRFGMRYIAIGDGFREKPGRRSEEQPVATSLLKHGGNL